MKFLEAEYERYSTSVSTKVSRTFVAAEDLKHPLLKMGKTKLLGISGGTSCNMMIASYIEPGKKKVYWRGQVSDIYFPALLLVFVVSFFNPPAAYILMQYTSKDKYEGIDELNFIAGGMPNCDGSSVCCPGIIFRELDYTRARAWRKSISKAIDKEDKQEIKNLLNTPEFRTIYTKSIAHYFLTNFNLDLGISGWPLSSLAIAKRNIKIPYDGSKILNDYSQMSVKDIKAIESNYPQTSFSSIINRATQNYCETDYSLSEEEDDDDYDCDDDFDDE